MSELVEIYTRERVCFTPILKEFDIEFVIYAYHDDGYSGYGFAFAKKGNKFYFHDMGHCSCYGPFAEFSLKNKCKSIEDMFSFWKKSNFYNEEIEEIEEILEIIKEHWFTLLIKDVRFFDAGNEKFAKITYETRD